MSKSSSKKYQTYSIYTTVNEMARDRGFMVDPDVFEEYDEDIIIELIDKIYINGGKLLLVHYATQLETKNSVGIAAVKQYVGSKGENPKDTQPGIIDLTFNETLPIMILNKLLNKLLALRSKVFRANSKIRLDNDKAETLQLELENLKINLEIKQKMLSNATDKVIAELEIVNIGEEIEDLEVEVDNLTAKIAITNYDDLYNIGYDNLNEDIENLTADNYNEILAKYDSIEYDILLVNPDVEQLRALLINLARITVNDELSSSIEDLQDLVGKDFNMKDLRLFDEFDAEYLRVLIENLNVLKSLKDDEFANYFNQLVEVYPELNNYPEDSLDQFIVDERDKIIAELVEKNKYNIAEMLKSGDVLKSLVNVQKAIREYKREYFSTIMVTPKPLSHDGRIAYNTFFIHVPIAHQLFLYDDLHFNPTLTVDYNIHELIPKSEVRKTIELLSVTPDRLPEITLNDAIVKYFGFKTNDLIRVYRSGFELNNPIAANINYRIVK